jgi:hypothetical protein
MNDDSRLLIVRQQLTSPSGLEALTGLLQKRLDLDQYTIRQRLRGSALVQLAKGKEPQLADLAEALRRAGYVCWLIASVRPRFAPARLRGLSIDSDAVEFLCAGDVRVRLERGMRVVGVLADLSGELAGKQVRRMLARNAYLGREQSGTVTPEETRQAIFKEQPVFDCYLLDAQGAVAVACRVVPGRFNPEGLGGRASLGATRNLEAVIELVREYAGDFQLHADFGLSQIPGCLPQSVKANPEALTGNLQALTRYGWLVAALAGSPPDEGEAGAISAGPLLVSGVGGAAILAGAGLAPEVLHELAGEIKAAVSDDVAAQRQAAEAQPLPAPLPPPPEPPERHFSFRRALPIVGTFLGGVLLASVGSADIFRPLLRQAAASGALPAALAIALCWGGFACLRLKRHIEDTPTSRVRSLAMGLVEVHGRAVRRYALVAPMTHSACAWYRLRKYRRDRNNRWVLASQSDSSHVPFVLDDGSGRVLIDPAGATIKVKTAQTGYPGQSALIGAAVEGGPDEKWIEELVYEGTTLYVLGYARPERGIGPGLRERTVERLRQLKLDPQARRRYDANGDGRLDADEWQRARNDAERQAVAEHLSAQRIPTNAHTLIGKPPRGLPFLIAETHDQMTLSRRYGWAGLALLISGLATFLLALQLSLAFFHVF